jgi:hypothetical protein
MAEALESRVKALEDELGSLKEKLRVKEKQLRTLQDIEDIKRLQCAYGYYLERWMDREIIDCFSDSPEVSGTFVEGTYKGKEGIRRYFSRTGDVAPEFLHQVMQVSPVITVDADGLRAKGRWYGYGSIGFRPLNGAIDPSIMSVVYEMGYIKEDGVWKILKLALQLHYSYNMRRMLGADDEEQRAPASMDLEPDEWAEFNTSYPSGYIYPMHFVHPVTGKPTSEAERNAKLKLQPSPFKPS